MPAHGLTLGGVKYFTIAADTNNVNLYTLCGSPSVRGDFVVTVAAGVEIYSTSTGTYAMQTTSNFPAGSTLKIIVLGKLIGAGGVGGGGGSYNGQGGVGGNGGPALNVQMDNVSIDAWNGYIWSGGGGGQGGAGSTNVQDNLQGLDGGGGGGGGQGRNGGTGGGGGTSNGHGGSNGSATAGGAGGAPANGGDFGNSGNGCGGYSSGQSQAYAVRYNNHAVTWIGGQPGSSRIKGKVAN